MNKLKYMIIINIGNLFLFYFFQIFPRILVKIKKWYQILLIDRKKWRRLTSNYSSNAHDLTEDKIDGRFTSLLESLLTHHYYNKKKAYVRRVRTTTNYVFYFLCI